MAVISLNDKRTSVYKYKRTGKEKSYHSAENFTPESIGPAVTDGLHSHWDFGNYVSYPESGSTVTDLTDNGHNGALENTSNISYSSDNGGHIVLTTSTISSNYPYVRRTTDYVSSVDTGDFTIEYWVNLFHKSNSDQSGNNALIFRNLPNLTSPYDENLGIYVHDENLRGSDWFNASGPTTAGDWFYLNSAGVYDTDQYAGWEHLVFSRIGTGNLNMKLYRNSTQTYNWTNKAQYNDTQTPDVSDNMSTFGRDHEQGIRGKLAIYRFYLGKGLTSTEVSSNYNLEKSRFGL